MNHTTDNGTTAPGARFTITQSRPNANAPESIGGLNRAHRLQRVEEGIRQAYAAIERVGRAADQREARRAKR